MHMNRFLNLRSGIVLCAGLAVLATAAHAQSARLKSVLVYGWVKGYPHTDAIRIGDEMITKMGVANGFAVTKSTDPNTITVAELSKYSVVVFNNCTQPQQLNESQRIAFETYMKNGGGYVGLHGAGDDIEPEKWPFYINMLGYDKFDGHSPGEPEATFSVDQNFKDNVTVKGIPATFKLSDELYNFKGTPRGKPGIDIFMTVDEKTYSGGTMGADHPVSWGGKVDKGWFFYSILGHDGTVMDTPIFAKHLLGALTYAAGPEPVSISSSKLSGLGNAAIGRAASEISVAIKVGGSHRVEVRHLNGRLVASRAGNGVKDYSFSGLNKSGIYMVSVKAGGESISQKVVLN